MIIEMRTYTLKPGNIPTFEERFGLGARHSPEILEAGGILAHRGRPAEPGYPRLALRVTRRTRAVRAEAAKAEGWPPNTRELTMSSRARSSCPRRSRRRSNRGSSATSTRSACTPMLRAHSPR